MKPGRITRLNNRLSTWPRFSPAKDREQKQQEKDALKSREAQHRLPAPFAGSCTGILSSSKLRAHWSLSQCQHILLCNQPRQLKLSIPTEEPVCAKQPDNAMRMTLPQVYLTGSSQHKEQSKSQTPRVGHGAALVPRRHARNKQPDLLQ